MDDQVPIEELYRLADRYASGEELPEWVDEFLEKSLPSGRHSELRVRRKKFIILREQGVTRLSDFAMLWAGMSESQRRSSKNKAVWQFTVRYIDAGETLVELAHAVGFKNARRVDEVLRCVYGVDGLQKLRKTRKGVRRERQWAKNQGVAYYPGVSNEAVSWGSIKAAPSPVVEE